MLGLRHLPTIKRQVQAESWREQACVLFTRGEMVMTIVVYEEGVLRLICGHAVQSGRSYEEKQSFYDDLKCE